MHPDPYIKPFMPGGSLFMRNPAIPLEVLYPHGIPAHVSKYVSSFYTHLSFASFYHVMHVCVGGV